MASSRVSPESSARTVSRPDGVAEGEDPHGHGGQTQGGHEQPWREPLQA